MDPFRDISLERDKRRYRGDYRSVWLYHRFGCNPHILQARDRIWYIGGIHNLIARCIVDRKILCPESIECSSPRRLYHTHTAFQRDKGMVGIQGFRGIGEGFVDGHRAGQVGHKGRDMRWWYRKRQVGK